MRLILRIVRLENRIEAIHQAHVEAMEYDLHWDAGEWSGPAHARAEQAAAKLGFASVELAYRIMEACR